MRRQRKRKINYVTVALYVFLLVRKVDMRVHLHRFVLFAEHELIRIIHFLGATKARPVGDIPPKLLPPRNTP